MKKGMQAFLDALETELESRYDDEAGYLKELENGVHEVASEARIKAQVITLGLIDAFKALAYCVSVAHERATADE